MMTRFSLGCAALVLAACGPAPLYTTADGVLVYPSETGFAFAEDEVELTLAITREHFSATTQISGASLSDSMMGLSIVHEDPPIVAPWGNRVRAYYQPDPPTVVIPSGA